MVCSVADRHGLDHDYAVSLGAQGWMSQGGVEKLEMCVLKTGHSTNVCSDGSTP